MSKVMDNIEWNFMYGMDFYEAINEAMEVAIGRRSIYKEKY